MTKWVPLTAAGAVVGALGLIAYISGWQLGWVELMVLTAGCLLALLVAVPFVVGRMRLQLAHTVQPQRVVAGSEERPQAILVVTNPGPGASRHHVVDDRVGDVPHRIRIPGLGRGEHHTWRHEIPNDRRGLVVVGPAVAARQDPLRLMRRAVTHAEEERCWIHPRHRVLTPLSAGFAKDLEGPTSDNSPAGDVAFHTLREYTPGDDYRHIHWMSSARSTNGQPVVRHYVDNRRPQVLALLDDRESVLAGHQFEVALEIVASMAVSSMQHREPLSIWTLAGPVLGRTRPGSLDDTLDQLTEAAPRDDGDLLSAALTALRTEAGVSALVLVTGPLDADALTPVIMQVRRRVRPIVVRVWPTPAMEPLVFPGARVVDVHDLDDFQRAWQLVTR